MGPNTNDETLMRKLVQNGMDIARFNFSHGDHEEQKGRMDMLKKIREEERNLRYEYFYPVNDDETVLLIDS